MPQELQVDRTGQAVASLTEGVTFPMFPANNEADSARRPAGIAL